MSDEKVAKFAAKKVVVNTAKKEVTKPAKAEAAKPAASKAPAKSAAKAPAKAAKSAPAVKSEDTRKITILVKENPKREGTGAFDRFELYKKAKTVAEFISAGGSAADVRYDEKAGYIKAA